MDVRWSQVRVLGEDLVGRHPVRDHRHDRGNREAQPPDARQPAHDSGVGGDAFVGHVFMLAASGAAAPYAVVAARLISAKAGELPPPRLPDLGREPRSLHNSWSEDYHFLDQRAEQPVSRAVGEVGADGGADAGPQHEPG